LNALIPGTAAKIEKHIALAKKIWRAFEVCATIVLARGGLVCIEWPKGCTYWQWDCVNLFLARNGFSSAYVDGCKMGVVSRVSGLPIRKPWRIACSDSRMAEALDRVRCPGKEAHPVHAPCAGSDTKTTENYTPYMAELVHQLFWQMVGEAQEAELGQDESPTAEDLLRAMYCIPI